MQDLGLAVRALHNLKTGPGSLKSSQPAQLVLAGGYDSRLAENRQVFEELQQLVSVLDLEPQVSLLLLALSCARLP